MALLRPEDSSNFEEVAAVGSVAQVYPLLPVALPSTIAASGSWQSGFINGDGFKALAAGVTSTQAGALTIQRYIDQKGVVVIGSAVSAPLTANTAASVTTNDGTPFGSFQVTITNTSGSTATLSNFALLMNAA